MVPCMFLMLLCMAFCRAARWGLQLQWSYVHAAQCAARGNCQKESQAYWSLGQEQVKADIPSVVSLLTKQPRTLQKHARLRVTMRKIIFQQRPAVGTHCTMLHTETSHARRPKRQICSLRSSILMSERLPLVTLVWRAVMWWQERRPRYTVGAVSELVDHVHVAECSGKSNYWVLLGDIQGKGVGQISRWLVVASRTRVVEC